ncbi:putative phage abortive infection protein [Pseudomonas phoenicis]|uniref:putative phage abortive infection protein n=1 Tax=unclassified Pseudomonas TaxID=196821 RepID=UPI00399FD9D1
MSWFALQVEALSYQNLMGARRSAEKLSENFIENSISDYGGLFFSVSVLIVLALGGWLYRKSKTSQGTVASFFRVAIVLLFVLFVYSMFTVGLLWGVPFNEIPDHVREGVFGDSFGTLNTLFSGLAFAGVLITLLFQRKDLTETRDQISRQQIESQFYILLSHQQELVRSFDVQTKDDNIVIAKGRDCFREWVLALTQAYKDGLAYKLDHPRRLSYQAIYVAGQNDLGVYFRSLYALFRFIDESGHEESQKLASIVRSLISDYELVLLFYNCLSEKGEKFSQYTERFALFDNLDESLLLNEEELHLFAESAYGGNQRLILKRANIIAGVADAKAP